MSLTIYFIVQAFTSDHSRYDRGLHHYPPFIEVDSLRERLSETFSSVSESIDPQDRTVAFCIDEVFDDALPLEDLVKLIEDTFDVIVSLTSEGLGDDPQAALCYVMSSCLACFKDDYGIDLQCSHKVDGFEPSI
jgi:hypothetical protein